MWTKTVVLFVSREHNRAWMVLHRYFINIIAPERACAAIQAKSWPNSGWTWVRPKFGLRRNEIAVVRTSLHTITFALLSLILSLVFASCTSLVPHISCLVSWIVSLVSHVSRLSYLVPHLSITSPISVTHLSFPSYLCSPLLPSFYLYTHPRYTFLFTSSLQKSQMASYHLVVWLLNHSHCCY